MKRKGLPNVAPSLAGKAAGRPIKPPAYPKPPRELAGKWVAWSNSGQILASGETLAEVTRATVDQPGVSYERLPSLQRFPAHPR